MLVLALFLSAAASGQETLCPQPRDLESWGLCGEEPEKGRVPPCYCDSTCSQYGDCCRNAAQARAGFSPYRCVTVSSENHDVLISAMVVAACPLQGPTDDRCEGSGLPLQDVPVVSTSGKLFRNVFCAECHGQHVPPFPARLQCHSSVLKTDIKNSEYDPTRRRWRAQGGECWIDTSYIFKYPRRSCVPSVDQCPSSSMHARGCRSYLARVYYIKTNLAYRNYHCALCAGVPENELDCYPHGNLHSKTTSIDLFSSHFDISILVDFHPPEHRVACRLWDPILLTCLNSTSECDHGVLRRNFYLREDGRAEVEGEIIKKSDYILKSNGTELVDCRSSRQEWQIALRHWLTWICVPLSIAALCVHLVVYCALPSLRTFPGKAVMSLSSSLLVAHSLLLLSGPVATVGVLCRTVAAAMHAAYLSALAWMTVLAWDLWDSIRSTRALRSEAERGRRFLYCSLCAWGVGGIFVSAAGALEVLSPSSSLAPRYGRGGRCWLSQGPALLLWFVGPLAASMSANVVLFVLTSVALRRSERPAIPGRPGRLGVAVKLSAVLGLPWIFGLLAPELPILWPFFIVLTGLQGVFVFLAFTFKARVWRQLRVRKAPVVSYSSNTNLSNLHVTSSSSSKT